MHILTKLYKDEVIQKKYTKIKLYTEKVLEEQIHRLTISY